MSGDGTLTTSEIQHGALEKCKNLINFYNEIQEHELLRSEDNTRLVIYADDQYINQQGVLL